MLLTKQFLVIIDFHSIFSFCSMEPTTVGYRHFAKYFVQHKNKGHKGLEQLEGVEMTTDFSFLAELTTTTTKKYF